jgi:membrane protease subunit HflC
VKTLDTYKTTLGRDSTLVLSTDSDLFSLLKSIGGKAAPNPAANEK